MPYFWAVGCPKLPPPCTTIRFFTPAFLVSSAKRFITSVRAASSPFLSVITEPPIFRITGFASLNSLSLFSNCFVLWFHIYFCINVTVSFSMRIKSPVSILEISILSTQGISEIMAPTATTVSHSLLIIPAGATPFFFSLYSV